MIAALSMLVAFGCGGDPGPELSTGNFSLIPPPEDDDDDSGGTVYDCSPHFDAPNHDSANLIKYWNYRNRLKAQFLKVSAGDEPGTNLPAQVRNNGHLTWGDTTIHLGQYLATLATEQKLHQGRQPARATETAQELLYALQALERLDRTGETYFFSSAPSTNGFFVRDDVPGCCSAGVIGCDVAPSCFLQTFPLSLAASLSSNLTAPYPVSAGGSQLAGYHATEMSQDQVWHLLVGLALVKKLCDVDVTHPVTGVTTNLRAYAKMLTFRILSYMKTNLLWMTRNPITNFYALRGAEPDAMLVYSYGFAKAGDWILSKDDPADFDYPQLSDPTTWSARDAFKVLGEVDPDQDAQSGQRALATVGDIEILNTLEVWRDALWRLEHETIANSVRKMEQYPLIYVVLHGDSTRISRNLYGGLLNAAPPDGPWNSGGATVESCAWSSFNRLIWPEWLAGNAPAWAVGQYNGLDYMLLHNLYQLVYNQANLSALYGPLSTPPVCEPWFTSCTGEGFQWNGCYWIVCGGGGSEEPIGVEH